MYHYHQLDTICQAFTYCQAEPFLYSPKQHFRTALSLISTASYLILLSYLNIYCVSKGDNISNINLSALGHILICMLPVLRLTLCTRLCGWSWGLFFLPSLFLFVHRDGDENSNALSSELETANNIEEEE